MGARKHFGKQTGKAVTTKVVTPQGEVHLETFVPWTVVKPQPAKIIAPADAPAFTVRAKSKAPEKKDSTLVRALGLAHYWQRLLDEQRVESVAEIADREGLDSSQVNRLLRLTRLAPQVIEYLADTPGVTMEWVAEQRWPRGWQEQEALVGVSGSE